MKTYIFDLDGTLWDSMGLWSDIDVKFLSKRGLSVPPDYVDKINALGNAEGAKYTVERFNLPDTPEDLMREWHDMAISAYTHDVKLKPYALEYLNKLRAGGAKLGIATSLSPDLHTPALISNGIAGYFDAIAHSDEVGYGKTRPDVFLLAAERLGAAPSDCLIFEDVLAAVKSAKSVGMTVCAVYDESTAHLWPSICAAADYAITDFRDAPLI